MARCDLIHWTHLQPDDRFRFADGEQHVYRCQRIRDNMLGAYDEDGVAHCFIPGESMVMIVTDAGDSE